MFKNNVRDILFNDGVVGVCTKKNYSLSFLCFISAESVYTDLTNKQFRVLVTYFGHVVWETAGRLAVSCPLVMTYFPFDSHMCDIRFDSWSYSALKVRVDNATTDIKMDNYSENGQWAVEKADMSSNPVYVQNMTYDSVAVNLYLRRKPLVYGLTVLIPCMMLSFLVILVFWLPADAGEKVSLGITVLLSFSVFNLTIAETLPKTSDSIPFISKCSIFCLVLSTKNVSASTWIGGGGVLL